MKTKKKKKKKKGEEDERAKEGGKVKDGEEQAVAMRVAR